VITATTIDARSRSWGGRLLTAETKDMDELCGRRREAEQETCATAAAAATRKLRR
jgi:hypothetical protein